MDDDAAHHADQTHAEPSEGRGSPPSRHGCFGGADSIRNDVATPAPDLPPDPPPPAWRWETTASLALAGSLVALAFMAASPADRLLMVMSPVSRFTLVISILVFGMVLGFSGARQGSRTNRIVAALVFGFHAFMLFMLLMIG